MFCWGETAGSDIRESWRSDFNRTLKESAEKSSVTSSGHRFAKGQCSVPLQDSGPVEGDPNSPWSGSLVLMESFQILKTYLQQKPETQQTHTFITASVQSHWQYFIHTLMVAAAMQDQNTRSSLGLGIWSKDTSTCRPGESNQRPSDKKTLALLLSHTQMFNLPSRLKTM